MMRAFFRAIDDFLRGRGAFAATAPLSGRLAWLFVLLISCGLFYGAVMGTYSGLSPARLHQLLYSGVKVPLLLLATFLLCLPSFFVINSVAGLRDDFREVLRAIVATQSCITVVLAGLAPATAFWYLSCGDYRQAVLFNAVMFGVGNAAAQIVVRRYYGPLIRRTPRHRQLLWAWFFLYAFVGIQMAWVLRPFIGDPSVPVTFFRSEAWGNAYVVFAHLIAGSVTPGDALRIVLWLPVLVGLATLALVIYRIVVPRRRSVQ
jgi:hypothetical protein